MDAFQSWPGRDERAEGGDEPPSAPITSRSPRRDDEVEYAATQRAAAIVAPRFPHPLRSLPPRPGRWERRADRRDRRDAGAPVPRVSLVEGWREPTLRAAPDLGQVRVNFTYGHIPVAAGYSDKARRTMFFEGPNEPEAWRLYEAHPFYTDVQFQPITIEWLKRSGAIRAYTLDGAFETEDGGIGFAEVKGRPTDFTRAEIDDLTQAAAAALGVHGARFDRLAGSALRKDEPRWRAIKDVFDDRRSEFDPARDVDRVHAAVAREGGVAPLGRVLEAIGGPIPTALRMANAMMVRRHLAYPLDCPPLLDAPVRLPRAPASPGVLRAFLRRHAAEA